MYQEKIYHIKKEMEKRNIDIMILRLPENVLYLSGYWPVMGLSLLLFPREGEPILIVPKSEEEYAEKGWVRDIRVYGTETLSEIWHPLNEIYNILKDIEIPKGTRAGCELNWETMSTNSVVGELNYPSSLTFETIRKAWNVEMVDITDMLLKLRMVKSEYELRKIRLANELAEIGIEALLEKIEEGVKESELAAEAERAIYAEGVGFKGEVERARGFAFVMSGENSSKAWYPFNISSGRRIRKGDVILLEFNVCADGYWTDITRTWVLGTPTKEQEEMYSTIVEAQEVAFKNIKDGISAKEADRVVREYISNKGYSSYYPHRLGHGIGLRIHELPALHPASKDILKENMVHTVEPGLYTKNFGIRLEDDVIVLKKGVKNLSPFAKFFSLKK